MSSSVVWSTKSQLTFVKLYWMRAVLSDVSIFMEYLISQQWVGNYFYTWTPWGRNLMHLSCTNFNLHYNVSVLCILTRWYINSQMLLSATCYSKHWMKLNSSNLHQLIVIKVLIKYMIAMKVTNKINVDYFSGDFTTTIRR